MVDETFLTSAGRSRKKGSGGIEKGSVEADPALPDVLALAWRRQSVLKSSGV